MDAFKSAIPDGLEVFAALDGDRARDLIAKLEKPRSVRPSVIQGKALLEVLNDWAVKGILKRENVVKYVEILLYGWGTRDRGKVLLSYPDIFRYVGESYDDQQPEMVMFALFCFDLYADNVYSVCQQWINRHQIWAAWCGRMIVGPWKGLLKVYKPYNEIVRWINPEVFDYPEEGDQYLVKDYDWPKWYTQRLVEAQSPVPL